MIMERNLQPVIVFSFSRRDCESYALQMSKLDFNSGQLCMNVCTLCFYVYVYMCEHTHMCVCAPVCVCLYTYIHTCKFTDIMMCIVY